MKLTKEKGYTVVALVVPYIGTWIETDRLKVIRNLRAVVPYIGTWIETDRLKVIRNLRAVVPYIGTWIETSFKTRSSRGSLSYLI